MSEQTIAIGDTEKAKLQKMQNKICRVSKVFGCCFGKDGKRLTEMSGNTEDLKRISKLIPLENISEMVANIQKSSMEELMVEDTVYPWLKFAAIDIKSIGGAMLTWIFGAILEDMADDPSEVADFQEKTVSDSFYSSLDLILDSCRMILGNQLSKVEAEAESIKCRSSEEEMGQTLKKMEAMTEVVQLLERDDEIELIMSDFLKIAGKYLAVSNAKIYQRHYHSAGIDLITEWNHSIDEVEDESIIEILKGEDWKKDNIVIVSSTTPVEVATKNTMERMGISAFTILPIFIHGRVSMYVTFEEKKADKVWSTDDIRFMSDTVKVLQSIITKRVQKNSLASSYESLETVLNNVGCGIYVCDKANGELLFINNYMRKMFPKEIKEGKLDTIFGQLRKPGQEKGSYEFHYFERSAWYNFNYTSLTWMDGRKVYLSFVYDITDKKEYQRKIEQQAYTDFLTGLFNRMCCERDLARMVDTAKNEGTRGAILYLDLDDFKHINDGLGHQYGDVLLRAIAHSIQRIAGITDTCYRMGGDEFVIVIPPSSYDECDRIIEEIHDVFSKPWFLKDTDYYCTMSMGVVTFPDDGDNVDDLIKKADISMYDAKKSGKNRVAKYDSDSGASSNRRLSMEKNMRDATVKGCGEFELYYQPIIDVTLEGNPCTGAEALVRWNNDEMGFVPPADFIPLAEYLGLINPIGDYILEQACTACRGWNAHGHPNYKVNVNLSVIQLLQPDIVDKVRAALEKSGLNPHNLTLEVTESLAINDMKKMREVIDAIKALGVRVALDDFGTGYSSLSHIREIPLDVIKVDQGFVRELAEDSFSQAFVKMIAELAQTLGLQVCVEGIETEEQFRVLDGMNVKMIQGYYFDRPMCQAEFEKKYV